MDEKFICPDAKKECFLPGVYEAGSGLYCYHAKPHDCKPFCTEKCAYKKPPYVNCFGDSDACIPYKPEKRQKTRYDILKEKLKSGSGQDI